MILLFEISTENSVVKKVLLEMFQPVSTTTNKPLTNLFLAILRP